MRIALLILFCLLGLVSNVIMCDKPEVLPNIILIYADDMGYGDFSFNNQESKITTPHIDALARSGKVFTDAHSAASVCTPSRFALLTGNYPYRSKLKKGVLWTYSMPLFESNQETIGSLLQEKNYHTGLIGKWHLGFHWPITQHFADSTWSGMNEAEKEKYLDFKKKIEGGPTDFGFNYFFGMDTPNFPPYAFIRNKYVVGPLPKKRERFEISSAVPGVQQADWKNEQILPAIRAEAKHFIVEQAKTDNPFFLFLSLTAPHTPITPTDEFKGRSQAGDYGDLVIQVDDLVGELMAMLKSLGIYQNTLVIFTSDNGSPGQYAEGTFFGTIKEKYNHYPNGNLRGLKGDSWEGGHRVPMIFSWPKRIKPSITNQLLCQTDIAATLAELVGGSLRNDMGLDSYSIYDLLIDRPSRKDGLRSSIITQSGQGHLSYRQNNLKYIQGRGSGGLSAQVYPREDTMGLERQLYDLRTDPGEQNNLFNVVSFQSIVDSFEKHLSILQ